MRIDGLGRATGAGPQRPGAARGAFQLSDPVAATGARGASAPPAPPALDALLALQTVEDETPRRRRRREIDRGRSLLDALDGMKLALIDGRDDKAALTALSGEVAKARAPTGDAGLDDALSAIELRVLVEMAKRGQ
jgi:hypothetical protein